MLVFHGTLYAGAKNGGLWTSSNNGQSWDFSGTDLFEGRGVSNIEPNPTNNGDILLSCAHGEMHGMGIFRTLNGGGTWSRTLPTATYIVKIERNPLNSNEVYAISESVLYKSTDGGSTWSIINGSIQASQISAQTCNGGQTGFFNFSDI